MKHIAIISHCYCPPGLDVYAEHLRWQWASLLQYPSDAYVTLIVCCAFRERDAATWKVLEGGDVKIHPLRLRCLTYSLSLDKLFRRAIGRNDIATHTGYDIYWFADVDYLFGPVCLDAVAEQVGPDDELCCPEYVNISTSHEIGQQLVNEYRGKPIPPIPTELFTRRRQKVAIGGCQIVGGNTARRVGYCQGTKWLRPVDPNKGFRSCKCDRAFRRSNKFTPRKLDLPNVFRLRHDCDGRDYDLTGNKIGKGAW